MSKKKKKRVQISSAERRKLQDRQAIVVYVILGVVAMLGWVWTSVGDSCMGALQGTLGPLLIIMLRYVLRITTGHRRDPAALLSAALFVAIFSAIIVFLPPLSLWNAPIVFLGFVATVIGIHRFKLSPIIMLLNCMVAGAILL